MEDFTKELDGTLLIVTEDDRTYELSRMATSNYISISPDKGVPEPSVEEKTRFMKHWENSNCRNR